jgi:endonuclease YncB( thermonuclease family)
MEFDGQNHLGFAVPTVSTILVCSVPGRVVGVSDGDTITVRQGRRACKARLMTTLIIIIMLVLVLAPHIVVRPNAVAAFRPGTGWRVRYGVRDWE